MYILFLSSVNLSLRVFDFRDHPFDDKLRDQRKHKRPSGQISKPGQAAHGEQGVRQYHRRDDSKVPAHRRLGFLDLPTV